MVGGQEADGDRGLEVAVHSGGGQEIVESGDCLWSGQHWTVDCCRCRQGTGACSQWGTEGSASLKPAEGISGGPEAGEDWRILVVEDRRQHQSCEEEGDFPYVGGSTSGGGSQGGSSQLRPTMHSWAMCPSSPIGCLVATIHVCEEI